MDHSALPASTRQREQHMLQPPRMTKDGLEVSVHIAPKALIRELKFIFRDKSFESGCLAIPTCQKSQEDLVNMGEDVEFEKDRCLNVFSDWARHVCERLATQGHWADFIDPCSGLPMLSPNNNSVYSEVEGMQLLLRYSVLNAGMCRVLLHPVWGSAVYPATLFTTAPHEAVAEVLEEFYQIEDEGMVTMG
mmetsp:Transcript_7115/g.10026  ORF Transcript_7115/g.10026 Transcript_7115/m.10026 type:complete len:191 (+) Transcript_7115:3-575(+)